MATVNVEVNGRSFKIACNDGEDAEVLGLAAAVDAKVQEVVSMVGQIGDERLLLMAAMLLADEGLAQAEKVRAGEAALAAAQAENARLQAQLNDAEDEAADHLEAAAGRIEAIIEALQGTQETK